MVAHTCSSSRQLRRQDKMLPKKATKPKTTITIIEKTKRESADILLHHLLLHKPILLNPGRATEGAIRNPLGQ